MSKTGGGEGGGGTAGQARRSLSLLDKMNGLVDSIIAIYIFFLFSTDIPWNGGEGHFLTMSKRKQLFLG